MVLTEDDINRIGKLFDDKLEELDQKWSAKFDELAERLERLSERLEYQENQNRRENLILIGIPSKPNESWEDTRDIVVNVAKKSNINIENGDISRAHRLRSSGGKAPPIIVKFSTWYAKEKLLKEGKKVLKNMEGIIVKEDFSAAVRDKRKRLSGMQQAAYNDGKKTFFRLDRLHVGDLQFHVSMDDKIKCGSVEVLNVAEARMIWGKGEDIRKRNPVSPASSAHKMQRLD